MAVWQFDVMASREDGGTNLPFALRLRAQKLLREGFGTPWRMTRDWEVFGDKNGNRIDLLSSADGTCELSARIDARVDDEQFLTCLIVLLIEMECDLYAPELDRHFPGQMDLLKVALQDSAAWRYAIGAQ